MSTTTTFFCGHTVITYSSHSPNPHLPKGTHSPVPTYIPFSCRGGARAAAEVEDGAIRAEYDPRITELRDFIQGALDIVTRDNTPLWEALHRGQEKETRLMVRKERKLLGCWRVYRERWG